MAGGKLVVVALVAAVIGAAIGGVITSVTGTPDLLAPSADTAPSDGRPRAGGSTDDAVRHRTGQPTDSATSSRARSSQTTKPLLDDAGITEEERAWLREALQRERERREQAIVRDDDGGVEVLDRWAKSGADIAPLAADFASMRRHIRTAEGPVAQVASTGEVTAVDLSTIDPKATVLEFGPGRFVLSLGRSQWNSRRADVESLEVRGAGIDRTTLAGPGWAFLHCDEKSSVKNLVLRDFAIDCADPSQILLDARGRMSVAIERVRVLGWQDAGHSAVVGVTGAAFLACLDCEFLGPPGSFALSLRGGAVATFERCKFANITSTIIGGGAAALGKPSVVTMNACTFENAALADSRVGGEQPREIEITVRGGTVAIGSSSWTEEARRKKWGAEYAAEVDGVTFGPAIPAFTVADMVRVLEAAPAQGIEIVVQANVSPGGGARPTLVDLYAWDRTTSKATGRTFRWTEGSLVPVTEGNDGKGGKAGKSSRGSFRGQVTADEVMASLPMLELVRGAGIPSDESVTTVEFGTEASISDGTTERRVRLVMIGARSGTQWLVESTTGKPFPPR